MAPLAEAFVRMRPDLTGFKSETERGIGSANLGKLGEVHGRALGDGITRGADGRLRDARGRFIKSISDAVGPAGEAAGTASGRRAGTSFGGGFFSGMRPILAGVGGVLAGIGLIQFFRDSVAEQRESIRVGNLTAAVLKSTGGAARITADQVGSLATRLSNLTGVDDEAIQSGENLLLTFTGVRNAVGKGNDIFNQASAAVLDMTAALHNGQVTTEGINASTIQLGKALNDPIQGMTALRRVGVSFTEAQVKQITAMQQSGNIMGAQKVILAELSKEFGGAAAAAADPAQKATVAWGNFKEQIGGFVLPILATLTGFLTGRLMPVVTGRIVPAISALVGWLRDLGLWFRAGFNNGIFQTEGLAGVMNILGAATRVVVDAFRDHLIPALKTAIGWLSGGSTWAGIIRQALIGAAIAIGAIVVALKLWTAAQTLLNIALTANPIGIIIVAIAALVAGLIYAYRHSETFRNIVNAALHGVAEAALWLWNVVLKPTWDALVAAFRFVAGVATWLWRNILEPAFRGIATVAMWLWNNVLHPAFEGWRLIMVNVIAPIVTWLANNVVRPAFQAIWVVIQIAWAIIRQVFDNWRHIIVDVLAPVVLWLWRNVIEPSFRNIWGIIQFAWNNIIKPVFSALGSFIRDTVAPAFRTGVDAIRVAWERVRDAAKAPVNFVIGTVINKGIIDTFNTIAGFFGVKSRVGHIATLARGGIVPGTGRGDTTPAMLTPGERVLSLPQVAALGGHAAIDAMVGRGTGGNGFYAGGGIIGLLTDPVGFIRDKVGGAIGAIGDTRFGQILSGMAGRARDALVDKAKAMLSTFLGPGVTGSAAGGAAAALAGAGARAASGQLGAWIAQGIALTGVPASWAGPLAVLIRRESGGNPRSINLSDINARRGDPSRGLMQTIGATFAHYRDPRLPNDIYNPVANIVAGIRYILARYGTIFRVQQANPNLPPRGYLGGGMVPGPVGRPQPAIVHGGERVLSRRELAQGLRLDEYTIGRLAQALSSRPVQVGIAGPDWDLSVAGVAP